MARLRRAPALRLAAALAVVAPVAMTATVAGCNVFGPTPCDRTLATNPYALYVEGQVVDGVYLTSNWDGTTPAPSPPNPAGLDAGCAGAAGAGCAPATCSVGSRLGLLYFPGGMRYQLAHHLGATPGWVNEYLSFDQCGASDGGTVALAAGNQVEITQLDSEFIYLANGSCSEYWLLVTAGPTGTAQPAPPGG